MIRSGSSLLLLALCWVGLATAANLASLPIALPHPAVASSKDQEVIREILELERQSKDAAMRRDASFTERTLADDYLGIGPLGQVTTKSETVTARKSAQLRYDSIDLSDLVVRLYGNTAIVTGRADVKGKDLGEDFSGPYRYTRVWVKRNGQWQTASYQATVTR